MNKRDPENPIVKITLLLLSTLIVMVTGVIGPALPAVQVHFADVPHADLWVRLVLTVPCLTIALSAPLAGWVVDRVGRKPVLVIATFVFGMCGIAGYLAPTLAFLLISRASLGVAVGALMTSLTTLIVDYYAGAARGRFIGLQAAFMGLGGTAFTALGGVLADIGWRVPFLPYAFTLVILPLTILVLYEPRLEEKREQRLGPLSGPGYCVAESWRAAPSRSQVRGDSSSAPGRLYLLVFLVMLAVQAAFFTIGVQLPFYLEERMLASAAHSGFALSVMSLSYTSASLQYSRLVGHLDHPTVLIGALTLVGTGLVLIWLGTVWAMILLGLSLVGVGMGLLEPDLTVWLADESPIPVRGRVVGGLTTALFLGRFISPILGQPVRAVLGLGALFLSAGVLLLMLAAVLWLTRRQLDSLAGLMPVGVQDAGTRSREGAFGAEFHGPAVCLNLQHSGRDGAIRQASPPRCAEGLHALC